jgi:aquaporin TIP
MHEHWSRVALAEALGVFALTFIGVLAISVGPFVGADGASTLTTVAFAHGLTIAVMVAALAAISGAHFNPAVTFGFVVTGRMTPATGLLYWGAQLVGATAAAGLLCLLFGSEFVAGGTPDLNPAVTPLQGIVLEAVTTFFLVLVIFGSAVDERAPRSVFPLAIGLTIVLDIMAIGPLTGAALNPARAFGPALASGHWAHQLVYWVGPLAGGALAALVAHHLLLTRAPTAAVAEHGGPAPSEERGGGRPG